MPFTLAQNQHVGLSAHVPVSCPPAAGKTAHTQRYIALETGRERSVR